MILGVLIRLQMPLPEGMLEEEAKALVNAAVVAGIASRRIKLPTDGTDLSITAYFAEDGTLNIATEKDL